MMRQTVEDDVVQPLGTQHPLLEQPLLSDSREERRFAAREPPAAFSPQSTSAIVEPVLACVQPVPVTAETARDPQPDAQLRHPSPAVAAQQPQPSAHETSEQLV